MNITETNHIIRDIKSIRMLLNKHFKSIPEDQRINGDPIDIFEKLAEIEFFIKNPTYKDPEKILLEVISDLEIPKKLNRLGLVFDSEIGFKGIVVMKSKIFKKIEGETLYEFLADYSIFIDKHA